MENMRSSLSKFSFIGLLLALSSCFYLDTGKKQEDLPNFAPLNSWLYRGGQPSEAGLTQLKGKGIRTVVNFREEDNWDRWEKETVEALGMNYVNIPWSIMDKPDPKIADRFFEVLDKKENRPVFFHCKHGRDRTGVMSTLALMRYEELPEDTAREIALETIRPHLRYRPFVNKKIDTFTRERPSQFSKSSETDH